MRDGPGIDEVDCLRPRRDVLGPITDCVGFKEFLETPMRRRELASSRVTVVIGLAGPMRVPGPSGGRSPSDLTSFVSGPREDTVSIGALGPLDGFVLRLDPLTAYSLFGPATGELGNAFVDLAEVWGSTVDDMTQRLADASTWGGRFRLLGASLNRRRADGPRPDRAVEWAWRRLKASGGRARVAELADELGWTRRHLARRFQQQVGLSPKTAARVLRFERVIALVDKRSGSLGEIAAHAGYSDHAHLGREVRELAGCAPGELAGTLASQVTAEPAVMSHLFKAARGAGRSFRSMTKKQLPAPARGAIATMYVGILLTIVSALAPYLAGNSLSQQIHSAEDGYVKAADTDAAIAAVQITLASVAAVGVLCWLGMILAVHKRQRWTRLASTVVWVLAASVALIFVSMREYGHALMPAGIGAATLAPSLAGLVAVVLLWMWKREDAAA